LHTSKPWHRCSRPTYCGRWPPGNGVRSEANGDFRQAQDAYQRVIDTKPAGLIMRPILARTGR
jgi:hypothetical protein